MDELKVKKAARAIRDGGVIAYPTEAVWGLGCHPWNEQACLDLMQVKQRVPEKGMILVAGSMAQFGALLTTLTPEIQQQLHRGWADSLSNGPVTYLVPDELNLVPGWIKGKHDKVAVRVSHHYLVKQLCKELNMPLVSTSANLAGRPAARSRLQVEKHMGRQIDYILPGRLGGARQPSRIIDLLSGQIRR